MKVRRATRRDAAALIAFNGAMALETEGKTLMPHVVGAGVRHLLRRPDAGFYLVAESGGEVIAGLMVTTEWSDWRNGEFWWIQSVYVRAEFRRKACTAGSTAPCGPWRRRSAECADTACMWNGATAAPSPHIARPA